MRASIVVPTRDRPGYLVRCLEALFAQSMPVHDFEIIVVDDGSIVPVRAPDVLPRVGLRVVVLRRERSGGPAAARNAGIAVATGAVVAFTDDDCRPAPTWLEGGCRAIEKGLDVATGRTLPDPREQASAGPWDYAMDVPGPDPRFSTCNCFYRAEVLRGAGGFRDPFASSAGYHLGEDTDLGWRAVEAGARAGFVPEALVHHAVRPRGYLEHLRSRRRLENLVALVKRYPGVARAHLSSHLHSVTHVLAYLAAAGVATSAWSAWGLSLLLPYAAWQTRQKRLLVRSPWRFVTANRALPQRFVADLYECFVLARASVKHRHLFL